MSRIVVFAYGLVAYAAFLVTIVYAIGFLGNFAVPKPIDAGVGGSVGTAVLINVLLLAAFAIQHTIMARPAFKARWMKIIPPAAERSTFVLVASLLLGLIFWQWRPIAGVVWQVDHLLPRVVLYGLFLVGWSLVFYSSFLIDHFDLFGLKQVYCHLKGKPYSPPVFRTVSLYEWVRHPLMLGFVIASWAAPAMTYGHLLFAVVITAYIFIGIHIEERDLLGAHGDDYRRYLEETPMLLPWPKKRAKPALEPAQPGT